MTTAQAARLCGVHITTISKLCRVGALRAERIKGRGTNGSWDIKLPAAEIVAAVKASSPYLANRPPTPPPVDESRLGMLFEWAALPAEKRALALTLAKTATTDELNVLLQLLR